MLNLDTHILLYAVTGDLTAAESKLLRIHPWSISAIVLWEIAKLAQLGRIEVDLADRKVKRVLRSVYLWPITADIARMSTRLDVHGDPADELIGATSIVHEVPLITRDRSLRQSRKIPLAQRIAS
jgi:PIN domain nuclease of toxin-antitoxin system